ncbi:MAG: hypothetical protein ACT4P1_12590 [Sporichthyaceae bacterium]
MRPTPEETIAGAERVLRTVLDDDLPDAAAATINDVLRMLGQAQRAAVEGPGFLAADNEALRGLLTDLIRELPASESGARARIHAYLTERADLAPR